ncbi:protein kinase [Aureococcus anophagefferens]|uniref:Protein kinase n=2 Tax=Aureococcus anophagefferens TaxID=44056 RepID=A0ABR1FVP7_AURAN
MGSADESTALVGARPAPRWRFAALGAGLGCLALAAVAVGQPAAPRSAPAALAAFEDLDFEQQFDVVYDILVTQDYSAHVICTGDAEATPTYALCGEASCSPYGGGVAPWQRAGVQGGDGRNSSLESTWAAQADLPPICEDLVEVPLAKGAGGTIGAYELTRRLGEGEFAAVYECKRAADGPDGKRYAVKAINKAKVQRHSSILKSKRNIRRVNLEVAAMRRFRHGGICQLYDVVQSNSFVYLVMEMGERDLFTFLDDHPEGCPEPVVKQVMRILALGLRHCHNAGVAHRDIKPENILVVGDPLTWAGADDRAGIVKLCDFGLCASVHDGAMLNDFVGSPGFFAPELMIRRQYDGPLADAWSMGAVMVEMLLGHRAFDSLWCPPYEHLHDVSAFSRGIREAVSRAKLGSAETPPSEPVRRLLEMLLQVEPERRANVEEVCGAKWFDLLKATANGAMQLLRLTFDRGDRPSFDGRPAPKPAERRAAYRETPRALPKIASEGNLAKAAEAERVDTASTAAGESPGEPPADGDDRAKVDALAGGDDDLKCKTPRDPAAAPPATAPPVAC